MAVLTGDDHQPSRIGNSDDRPPAQPWRSPPPSPTRRLHTAHSLLEPTAGRGECALTEDVSVTEGAKTRAIARKPPPDAGKPLQSRRLPQRRSLRRGRAIAPSLRTVHSARSSYPVRSTT